MPKIRIEVAEATMNEINNIKSELGLNNNQNGMAISHAISFYQEANTMESNKFISNEMRNVIDKIIEVKFKRLMPIIYELAVNSSIDQQYKTYKIKKLISNDELNTIE